ncbi:MAG TPA: class IV adenylate cyclase [Ignavibacteriaceae bacterium]|jgi:adenylate cyclase class 2|nr:class IV adenylate cyclase [Ignavibacteriaceae bacterium]
MPINLELKVRLRNPDEVLNKIKDINAEFKGELNQTDVYYKKQNGILKLRLENGTQTLIKYVRNEKSGERWSDYNLISLEKNDAREYLKDILEEEIVVEKQRLLYLYDNTRIHLDTVNRLGSFLELETLVINGKDDAGRRFENVVELLSLDKENELRKSYRDLMMEQGI